MGGRIVMHGNEKGARTVARFAIAAIVSGAMVAVVAFHHPISLWPLVENSPVPDQGAGALFGTSSKAAQPPSQPSAGSGYRAADVGTARPLDSGPSPIRAEDAAGVHGLDGVRQWGQMLASRRIPSLHGR
jgi:hypothetical protein